MVYIRIQITNGRNIARSFSPLIRLCASKKRESYISSINVNGGMKTNLETDPGEYCAKRKTFPLFFDASPHGIAGQSESIHSDFLCPRFHSGPRFAIRRFDTVARCFRTPATFLLLPPSARNRRENKRGQEVTQWR